MNRDEEFDVAFRHLEAAVAILQNGIEQVGLLALTLRRLVLEKAQLENLQAQMTQSKDFHGPV